MAELLKGAPVAAALSEKMAADVAALKEQGVTPPWPSCEWASGTTISATSGAP